jgi:lipopolysaccharide export system protein LptA
MRTSLIFISVIFNLLPYNAQAMPDDHKQVAQLSADSADLNQQTHYGEYIGNVVFDQGTTHLRASKAVTQGNEQNKLTVAIALGDNNIQAHYWEQTAPDKPLLHAYANEIRYYPIRHLIELTGDAQVIQGENSLKAPKISYDTLKKHVISKSYGAARTVIIFHPEKKP